MKPVTKSQKRVVELMSQLPLISTSVNEFAESKFPFRATAYKSMRYCLECGEKWKTNESIFTSQMIGLICPNPCCRSKGAELMLYDHNGDHSTDKYTCVLTYKKEYQLVRVLHTTKRTKKNKAADFFHKEVAQYWIRITDGKIEVASKNYTSSYYRYMIWAWGPIEIKKNHLFKNVYGSHSSLLPFDNIYPVQKIHPILKRNGYKKDISTLHPVRPIYALLNFNFAETMVKSKQIKMFDHFCQNDFSTKHEKEIMTCIKNKYIINEPVLWKDTIDLMHYFNKDVKNKKYCCPEGLSKVHDVLVEKRRKRILLDTKERLKDEIAKSQKEYSLRISRFKNLQFSNGNIKIEVLKNVEDFLADGDELKHCLFTNEYHKKKNSIIFRATKDNVLLENIQVKLNTFSIEQSRGKFNKFTEHHDEIIELVNANMHQIIEATKPKKRKNARVKKIA